MDKKEAQKRNASNFALSRTAMEKGKGYRSASLPMHRTSALRDVLTWCSEQSALLEL